VIGKIIKQLRKERDITQADLAKAVGVTTSSIGMYETGVRNPSYDVIVKLAKYFNVSTDFLLGNTVNDIEELPDFEEEDTSELKILFDKIRDLSEDDQKRINAIVEAFKRENQN
jgi:transcriptional regulator with XRE-family HTH domain